MNKDSIFPFNELSLSSLDNSICVKYYFDRIIFFNKLIRNDQKLKIAYHSSVLKQPCKDGQNFLEHINNSKLEKDNQGVLLSTIQETPFLEELQQQTLDHELYFNEDQSIGGAYAYFLNNAFLSIPSAEEWDKFSIEMQKKEINDNGELTATTVQVLNLGELNAENYKDSWVLALIEDSDISTPEQLFQRLDSDCQSIILSECAIDFINRTGGNLSILNKIYELSCHLNSYCTDVWKFGEIRRSHIIQKGVMLKDESEPTMQQYGDERIFRNHVGKSQQYRLHFNITDSIRGYIGGISDERKIFIAYLGNHLRTVRFN
ncbi:hypothetical protein PCO85_21110 [Prodigiosinella aquatilis]|nr:hypothetical protein [Prodigiosinella sp. LS101]WJV53613.1 hypothetical protein PCO85_21110 [Prodigiosinella sp. LS101]WJV57972.1 hypothetical protein PCO84_21085 [Pectobacteriaceae bacterium C111]